METTINGLKINYTVLGEGRPFLIVHGWLSKSDSWKETAEIISKKNFKVIIPDLPGFGKSETPKDIWDLDKYCDFVEEFADFMNLDKFCLLGHSFGGSIAIKFSLRHPKKVEKLFLAASSSIRKKNIKNKVLFIISKIFKVFSHIPLVRKAFYKYIVRKSDYIYSEGVMKGTFLKIIREDLFSSLSLIKTPTVIIWGDKDNVTVVGNAHLMNKEIKNSKLVIIPDASHDLERKVPKLLAEKIIENL